MVVEGSRNEDEHSLCVDDDVTDNKDLLQSDITIDVHGDDIKITESKRCDTRPVKKKSRLLEKSTFVSAVVVIVVLCQGAVSFPWILPHLYVIMTPTLVGYRIYTYWKQHWHYFLLDFCYYANTFCLLFLCVPDNQFIFSVLFSLSYGPLIWAILIYRNSLVLHSLDKVTSTYIHILPPLLSFVVRWFPLETSCFWFREFMPVMPELSPIWHYLVPFIAFVFHSGLYSIIVNYMFTPSEDTVSSYNYLGDKGSFLYHLFNCIGPRCRCGMFYFWNWVFCLLTLVGAILCYQFFVINCLCLGILSLVAIWNGGSYYVHVFSVRGFVTEVE